MLSSSNSRRVLPTIELTVRGPVLRRVFLLALAGLIVPAAAHAGRVTPVRFLSAVTTLVNDLAPRNFMGLIGELGVYSGALTPAEVQRLHDETKP